MSQINYGFLEVSPGRRVFFMVDISGKIFRSRQAISQALLAVICDEFIQFRVVFGEDSGGFYGGKDVVT